MMRTKKYISEEENKAIVTQEGPNEVNNTSQVINNTQKNLLTTKKF